MQKEVPNGRLRFGVKLGSEIVYLQVLLGGGYYAERSAKQTVEILRRREKLLESQVDSFQAVMEDLKLESSFFSTTASEVALCYWKAFVEIREEYEDESLAAEAFKGSTVEHTHNLQPNPQSASPAEPKACIQIQDAEEVKFIAEKHSDAEL